MRLRHGDSAASALQENNYRTLFSSGENEFPPDDISFFLVCTSVYIGHIKPYFRQYGKYVTQHGRTPCPSGRNDDLWQQGRSWTALRLLSCRTLPHHVLSIVITRAEEQPESGRWVRTGRPRCAPANIDRAQWRATRPTRRWDPGKTRKLPSAGRRGSCSQVGGAGSSERFSAKTSSSSAALPAHDGERRLK